MTAPATRHYAVHGVRVAVRSESDAVADALHARLRRFAVPADVDAGAARDVLSFDLRFGDAATALPPTPGDARPVYLPRRGSVTYSDAEDRLHLDLGDGVRAVCDLARGETHVVMPAPVGDATWLLSHPVLTLPLVEQLRRRGLHNVHAAALAVDGRALLVAGTSGAGKSTLAIALLRAGLDLLGDDMCFVSRDAGGAGARIHAFPDEVDVTDETAAMFPELRALLDAPPCAGWPKRRLLPEEVYDVRFADACRPAVIVFPRVAGTARSVLTPMARGAALRALAPDVLLTDARVAGAHLAALAALVEGSECWALATGRDLDEVPAMLAALL
jgi:hypothetical protein